MSSWPGRWIGSAVILIMAATARAAETDQFLTWGLELSDCAEALNARMNYEAEAFLGRVNERTAPVESVEELTQAFYTYLFQGLHSSRIRSWANRASEVDRYPDSAVSFLAYQRMSIYRDMRAFPFLLPMARTIRIGDIYLGVDKIGHFFGFGRRYFQRYLRYTAEGLSEEEAMEKVVRWGIEIESSFVGGLVDGIFSPGDLEANFQGFLMARECCSGDQPHFARKQGAWILARPFDMRDYITPDFDESYNLSYYTGLRREQVLRRLREGYCESARSPLVRARFSCYDAYAPSLSRRVIAAYFSDQGSSLQCERSLSAICPEPPYDD